MKTKYFFEIPDDYPRLERAREIAQYMKKFGKDFHASRRYNHSIKYTVILDDETVTYLMLCYGDILGEDKAINRPKQS